MKTKFLFLLLIGILLSVQVGAESQSMRKRIILKTATNTSQGTPRSVDPASWIIACYDVEDSKLFMIFLSMWHFNCERIRFFDR